MTNEDQALVKVRAVKVDEKTAAAVQALRDAGVRPKSVAAKLGISLGEVRAVIMRNSVRRDDDGRYERPRSPDDVRRVCLGSECRRVFYAQRNGPRLCWFCARRSAPPGF